MSIKKTLAITATGLSLLGAAAVVRGGVTSSHDTRPSSLGVARSSAALEAVLDEPGPIQVETITAAHWAVPRSGLINLDDAQAKAAGLTEGPEPIDVYFHSLRHPAHGLFVIDSGVERALTAEPERAAVRGLVRRLSGVDDMRVQVDLASWLAEQQQPLAGVLLTHLHLDHVLGLPDVPPGTDIYTGPGEASARGLLNFFTRPITDRVLEGHTPIAEWRYEPDPDQRFAGVIDVFADGSLWALHVPGHTAGSTAYVARTPSGPVAFIGDACHTRFGWIHSVEPGSFSSDVATSEKSLIALEALAARHPSLDVRLGHQSLTAESSRAASAHLPTSE